MNKPVVGLPESYSLYVEPVQLGDYLDEPEPPRPEKKHATTSAVLETASHEHESSNLNSNEPNLQNAVGRQVKAKTKKPKRRQINMSPLTEKKFDQIIAHVQDYSPQSDTAASEVMDAIISAHHKALTHLNFGSVHPRGRWGTPTAEAFKHSLARAFIAALIDYHSGKSSGNF